MTSSLLNRVKSVSYCPTNRPIRYLKLSGMFLLVYSYKTMSFQVLCIFNDRIISDVFLSGDCTVVSGCIYINLALRSTTVVLMHQWKLYKSHVLFFITKLIVLLSTKIITSSLNANPLYHKVNYVFCVSVSYALYQEIECTCI